MREQLEAQVREAKPGLMERPAPDPPEPFASAVVTKT